MASPLPITSPAKWLNGTVIAPLWTQSVQDALNGLVSYNSLNTLGALGATSLPTTGTTAGPLWFAWYGQIASGSTTVNAALNVQSVSRASAGSYTLTLVTNPVATSRLVMVGITAGAPGTVQANSLSLGVASVGVYNSSFVAADITFALLGFNI